MFIHSWQLLCLALEISLTGTRNNEVIAKIQTMPEEFQMNIMSLTTMVCDNYNKSDFDEIMQAKLRKSSKFFFVFSLKQSELENDNF